MAERVRRIAADPHERAILAGQVGQLVSKFISMATLIVSTPAILGYLGIERFGVWMTCMSLMIVMSGSDFGVGSGVMTALARASRMGDHAAVRSILTNGLACLVLIAGVLLAVFAACRDQIDWRFVFGLPADRPMADVTRAVDLFVCIMLAAIPFGLGQRIFMGFQESARNAVWVSLGSLASLGGLLLAIHFDLGLPGIVAGFIGGMSLLAGLSTVSALARLAPAMRPAWSALSAREVRETFVTGCRYLGVFLIYAVTFTIDNILIAHQLGPQAVAEYAVVDRIFQIVAVFLSMVNGPLWPAYAAAAEEGNYAWLRRRFRGSLLFNAGFGLISCGMLVLLFPLLIKLWIGPVLMPPLILVAAVAARRAIEGLHSAISMLLNALHEGRWQLLSGAAMAIAAVILRVPLIDLLDAAGSAVAVCIAVSAFSFLPFLFFYPRAIHRLHDIQDVS